jgi:hypothetical protein
MGMQVHTQGRNREKQKSVWNGEHINVISRNNSMKLKITNNNNKKKESER